MNRVDASRSTEWHTSVSATTQDSGHSTENAPSIFAAFTSSSFDLPLHKRRSLFLSARSTLSPRLDPDDRRLLVPGINKVSEHLEKHVEGTWRFHEKTWGWKGPEQGRLAGNAQERGSIHPKTDEVSEIQESCLTRRALLT